MKSPEEIADDCFSTVNIPTLGTRVVKKRIAAAIRDEREKAERLAIKVRCCFAGAGQACPIHEKG